MPSYGVLKSGKVRVEVYRARHTATCRHEDPRRHRRSRRGKEAARRWADLAERALDVGVCPYVMDDPTADAEPPELEPEAPLEPEKAGVWMARWYAARLVEKTTANADRYRWASHVLPKWEGVVLADVRQIDVQEWVKELNATGLGAESVRSVFQLFRGCCGAAVANGLIPANPCAEVKKPTPPPYREFYFTPAQVDALVDAARGVYRVVIYFAAYTGFRLEEVFGLKMKHLDLDAELVHAVGVYNRCGYKEYPKGKKRRPVPLTSGLVVALRNHLNLHPAGPDEFVFRNTKGRPVLETSFGSQVWRDRTEKPRPGHSNGGLKRGVLFRAGLAETGGRPGDLRDTYCSWLAQRGVPMQEIQKLAGHASGSTTERYAHLAPSFGAAAKAALEGSPRGETVGSRPGNSVPPGPFLSLVVPSNGRSGTGSA